MKYTLKILVVITTTIYNGIAIAQCAMCKASAETSLRRGAEDANWLNYGIIFLMLVPLTMLGVIYLLWKKNKSN